MSRNITTRESLSSIALDLTDTGSAWDANLASSIFSCCLPLATTNAVPATGTAAQNIHMSQLQPTKPFHDIILAYYKPTYPFKSRARKGVKQSFPFHQGVTIRHPGKVIGNGEVQPFGLNAALHLWRKLARRFGVGFKQFTQETLGFFAHSDDAVMVV